MEKLERIHWKINRFDTLRSYLSNRSAMVLSANALLYAAIAIFIQNISLIERFHISIKICVLILIIITIILLAISTYNCAISIANVWKTGGEKFDLKNVKRYFYHARITSEKYDCIREYYDDYNNLTDEELTQNALGELFYITKAHNSRYQNLRKAIRFFIYAMVPITTMLFGFVIIKLKLF